MYEMIITLLGTLCAEVILYCEALQLLPWKSTAFLVRAAVTFLLTATFCGLLSTKFLLQKWKQLTFKSRCCALLTAAMAAVCLMVWFPMPSTGLMETHRLEIRPIGDGEVLLTWLHTANGDARFADFNGEGDWERVADGLRLRGSSSRIVWEGKTGAVATVEFASSPDGGAAVYAWDGREHEISLCQTELTRLSFDDAFSPALGLPEFLAEFLLLFGTSLTVYLYLFHSESRLSTQTFSLLCALGFIVLRVCIFRTADGPLYFVDSESYLGTAEMSVKDILSGVPYCYPKLWYCLTRPGFVPLIYKACGLDLERIARAQLGISIVGWLFCAWQTAQCLRRPTFKKLLFLSILGLGCIPNVTRWDLIIMTESITIAVSLCFLGSLLWLTRERRALPAVCATVFGLLLIPTRDSSVWIVLLCAIVLFILCAAKDLRRTALPVALVLTVGCLMSMTNTGKRWQFPFENVLFARVLRDSEATEYFIRAGMPTPVGIESLYGEEHLQRSALFNSEGMAPLREWIVNDGLGVYFRYMLRTPDKTLRMAWNGFERETFEKIDYFYTPYGFRALLPDSLIKFFSLNLPALVGIFLGFACFLAAFRREKGAVWIFSAVMILSAYLMVDAVLLIDTYDFARHALVNVVLVKASEWFAIWMFADRLLNDKK